MNIQTYRKARARDRSPPQDKDEHSLRRGWPRRQGDPEDRCDEGSQTGAQDWRDRKEEKRAVGNPDKPTV